MIQTIQQKAERCGTLLARSPLDREIKGLILGNIGKLRESDLDALLWSLEREEQEGALIADKLDQFTKGQDQAWSELEQKQKARADEIVKEFADQLQAGS